MSNKTSAMCWILSTVLLGVAGDARANSLGAIETVYVGNPGNPGELSGVGAGGFGLDVVVGGVDYAYNMGKSEITAAQYTEFLNAVARDDTYGLYYRLMPVPQTGCGIVQIGSPGSYTYVVEPDLANRPVNWVSWGDAARYANWLHNGQPSGAQDLSTTEDGSYFLNGATTNGELMAIVRSSDATWVVPSEDEWYKAAYHKNEGPTNGYWHYPMESSALPDNGYPNGDSGDSANFWDGDLTIGPPFWRTEVGFFGSSDSPYGTFDQGGNVWEWNEASVGGTYHGLRGGSFNEGSFGMGDGVTRLHAANRFYYFPVHQNSYVGFRVAHIPEPATIALLLAGAIVILTNRQQARHIPG